MTSTLADSRLGRALGQPVLGRRLSRGAVAGLHVLLWMGGFAAALAMRFEGAVPADVLWRHLPLLAVLLVARLGAFSALRLFHGLFRYAGFSELSHIVAATGAATLVALGARTLLAPSVPPSMLAGELLASLAAVCGMRMLIRGAYQRHPPGQHRTTTLVIGANDTGESLVRDLSQQRAGLGFQVIGFLDEDPARVGSEVHGVPVLGLAEERTLRQVIVERGVQEVVFALPEVASGGLRQLMARARRLGARTRVVESVAERMTARPVVRDISLDDLLGRDPVRLDLEQLDSFLGGKVVLVTGAGGSIGSELCRQVLRFSPRALLLLDHDENALFFLERELRGSHPAASLYAIARDITDARGIGAVFQRHAPQVVLHAAAHKHVGIMENNACEAARNNVFGTQVLARAAHDASAEAFVFISTDKAVNPASVMGATKRVCEMIVQDVARESLTRFAAVRFGNVLGSNGSVVPLFQDQIARGGPVTVTHPEVERYFMTIAEAAGLVLQAGALGGTGRIFLLDMGAPVRILELARMLIEMHGLRPGVDIEIRYSGLQRGEKLHEELLLDAEAVDTARPHPKIVVGRIAPPSPDELRERLEALAAAVEAGEDALVREALATMVPQASLSPAGEPPPPRRRSRAERSILGLPSGASAFSGGNE